MAAPHTPVTAKDLLDRPAPPAQRGRSVGANTVSLAAARIVPMITGFAFWALAALSLHPARLGLGSALVSAILLAVQLGLLGIGPATVTLLPAQADDGQRLVTTSLLAVTCGALLVGAGIIGVTWLLGGPIGAAWADPAVVVVFLAAALLATLAYQLDHVAVARARSHQALTRSIVQGLVQLAALAVGLAAGTRGILILLVAVAAGAGASVLWGGVQLARRGWRPEPVRAADARLLVRHGLPNYALLLSDRAPGYLLPLVVTAAVSTSATASWYLVWMLSSAVFFVPQSAGYSLQAHLASSPGTRRMVVRTLRLSVALTAAAAIALVLLGPLVLARLGPAYAHGWQLLPIMAPGLVVGAVTQIYYGVCRARDRLAEATAVALTAGIVVVAPAALVATGHGLTGVSLLWLGGQGIAALLAGWRLRALTRPDELAPRPAAPGGFPPEARPRRWPLTRVGRRHASALLASAATVALGIGVWSLTRTHPAQIGSLGLAPALPPAYYAALAAAVIGPVLSCRRTRQVGWLLAWQLVVLIVLLHGIDPVVHGTPRLEASYRHLGIASYISGSGQLDPRLDAYFSWPGFFALLAMVSDTTGIRSLLGVATWAPLGADLLLLPVLVTLARRLAPGWRTAWAGVWVYFLTDWVGQDYLSPQTFAFQLALTVLAIVLVAFNGRAREKEGGRARRLLTRLERAPATRLDLPAGVRVGLLACCAVLLIAITVAHQLTPFALALVLVALALLGQSRLRFLSALAVLLPVAWLVLVATPYLAGHEATLFGSVGNLRQTTAASVSHRVVGDPGHRVVVDARLVETALVWVAAAAGAFTLRRRRRPWLAAAVCGAAPMLLLPAQPYGGELMLRVYLYGLPFAAGLAAVVLVPAGTHRWARTVAAALVGLLLAGTAVITRYGNDALETFTPGELALVRQLDASAPPGALVIEAVHDTPWRFELYATFRYRTLLPAHAQPDAPTLTCAHVEQLAERTGAFLLVTQSQQQEARLLGIGPPGDVQAFLATCQARPRWITIAATAAGTLVHITAAPPSRYARRPHHVLPVLPQKGHPSCQATTVCQPLPAR